MSTATGSRAAAAAKVALEYVPPAAARVPAAKADGRSRHRSRDPVRFLAPACEELDVSLDPATRSLWCYMRPKGGPCFTETMVRELITVRHAIQRAFATRDPDAEAPIRYFVGGSQLPGIYNLGGDLGHFVDRIRAGDRESLRRYARACVDVGYDMWSGFDLPVTTIALVQGDALGGGFEGALSFNVLVAERSAKFGLPEVVFNLFPGMGAYSFLSRKLDPARAERMIMSGRIYPAEELHDMGLIDVLAEDGQGEHAVRQYITRNARRHAVQQSIYDVRRRVRPLSLDELVDITEIWVEAALRLGEIDLRKMERLMVAQNRRLAQATGEGMPAQ